MAIYEDALRLFSTIVPQIVNDAEKFNAFVEALGSSLDAEGLAEFRSLVEQGDALRSDIQQAALDAADEAAAALGYKNAAQAAVITTGENADRSEAARDAGYATGKMFESVAAGVAGTTAPDYFSVEPAPADETFPVYRNVDGTEGNAELVLSFPTSILVNGLADDVRSQGAQIEDDGTISAVSDQSGNAVSRTTTSGLTEIAGDFAANGVALWSELVNLNVRQEISGDRVYDAQMLRLADELRHGAATPKAFYAVAVPSNESSDLVPFGDSVWDRARRPNVVRAGKTNRLIVVAAQHRESGAEGDGQSFDTTVRFVDVNDDGFSVAPPHAVFPPAEATGRMTGPAILQRRARSAGQFVLVMQTHDTADDISRLVCTTSSDGQSWSNPVDIFTVSDIAGVTGAKIFGSMGTPVEILSGPNRGRLVVAFAGEKSGGARIVGLAYTDNLDATTGWQSSNVLVDPLGGTLSEPSIALNRFGEIIGRVRRESGPSSHSFTFRSTDDGASIEYVGEDATSVGLNTSAPLAQRAPLLADGLPCVIGGMTTGTENIAAREDQLHMRFSWNGGYSFQLAYAVNEDSLNNFVLPYGNDAVLHAFETGQYGGQAIGIAYFNMSEVFKNGFDIDE